MRAEGREEWETCYDENLPALVTHQRESCPWQEEERMIATLAIAGRPAEL